MAHPEALTGLIGFAKLPLAAFGLGLARSFGLMQILPVTNRLGLTGMHRAGAASALALMMLPALLPAVEAAPPDGGRMALLAAKEGFIGVLLGVLFAVPFWTAEVAGALIDQQRGLQNAGSGQTDAAHEEETGTTGLLLVLTMSMLFFVSGGLHWVLDTVAQSYRVWPAVDLAPHLAPGGAYVLLGLLDSVLRGGFLLASPLVVAMLLAEMSLAQVSRFAPQLNVFDLSMSVKGLVQVFGLPLYAVFVIAYLRDGLKPLLDVGNLLSTLAGR